MQNKPLATIDEYIGQFPADVRKKLTTLRQTIKKAAPQAQEMFGYRMPAFKQNNKYLAFFAGYKNHIGFYPLPATIKAFKKELADFHTSKGAVQFPLDRPLPLALVTKMVKARLKEN